MSGNDRDSGSAMEGADIFLQYHPGEQKDADDAKDYISKVAPDRKVELFAQNLEDEKGCMEMVAAVKKWSGGSVHVLCVLWIGFRR